MIRRIKQDLILAVVVLMGSGQVRAADNPNINGFISGLSNQSNQEVGNVPGNKYWADFFFDYKKDIPNDLEQTFTLAARRNDQSLLMYSVQEAFVGGDITKKDNLKVGRVVLPWSTVDAHWGFGKLNNRRNFDGFEPGQEGLTGIVYERKSSNGMRYRVFGSGLYVPEMNPGLDINKRDRTITSRNPWADPPARTAEVETTPGVKGQKVIQYDVNYPNISDVIYRYTFGANLAWENKNFATDLFYIRKPENNLSTQVEVAYNVGDDVIKAGINPQVYYHDVFGGNLKYKNKDVEMYVSAIGIRPNTFPDSNTVATQYTEIKTQKIREDYAGAGISQINDLYGMGLGYVARLSPFNRGSDSLVTDPRWNQAVNLFAMRNFGQYYGVSMDLKYDMLTTDRLMMLKAVYHASKEFMMSVGVNMIGTPTNGESYWSPYTNNDSFYGSLRYVF